MRRISSGVVGLDQMIQGGFPENSIIGLEGPAGVGKSLFAFHFLLAGARENEKGVYLSLDEPRENVDRMLASMEFGKEFLQHERAKKIRVLCISHDDYSKVHSDIFRKIENDRKIKRLVIDSYNGFFAVSQFVAPLDAKHSFELRSLVQKSFSLFRNKEMTCMLLLEKRRNSTNELEQSIPFLVDGLVSLDFLSFGSIERRIFVPKMRWTKQYESSVPFTISGKGVYVRSKMT